MAKQLSKTGITTNTTIKAWHVTQSINALTGIDAYDILISGSLNITGSLTTTGTISASGDLLGDRVTAASYIRTPIIESSTGIIRIDDNINALGNITASGNISASGDLTADGFLSEEGKLVMNISVTTPVIKSATSVLQVLDNLDVVGQITASGNISASGDIYSTVFYSDRQDTIYYRPASDNIIIGGLGGKPLRVNGVYSTSNITASGIVEALTTVGNRNALAQNNSGGAINTTMTIAAFPRGTVTGVTQTTSNNAVAYTLPAIEAGLEYTFIATATSTGTGTTTFSAPSAILKGMAVCKDANEDISGTNFIFAAGKFEIGTRVYIIGDGTIYHITAICPCDVADVSTT